MKRIKYTTLGGEKKTALIRDDQLEKIQELLATYPELTVSGVINAGLDYVRLERASKRFPFDLYEVTGESGRWTAA